TLAQARGVPFYCAAGFLKFSHRPAHAIVVEERPAAEVAPPEELPPGASVFNPVFDGTPPDRMRAFITEEGLRTPPEAVARALARLPKETPW
ncbi:MAG: S-methyl-5-thioribose-1-phosphate isomerase, partial [Thermoplasmatota archaeon]